MSWLSARRALLVTLAWLALLRADRVME